jgi:ABC-type amino acid transport system permease subunit
VDVNVSCRDLRGRGVDSGASQKRSIEAFVCIALSWLFVVLVLSIAVLVLEEVF